MVLHKGEIAEMRTGEGKTLVAVLPAFLNALSGKSVHVVTVNDYLARRDCEWVGQVHRFLGLKVSDCCKGCFTLFTHLFLKVVVFETEEVRLTSWADCQVSKSTLRRPLSSTQTKLLQNLLQSLKRVAVAPSQGLYSK